MIFGFAMMTGMMATMTPQAMPPEPRRLSEQQVEQVLAEAAARREASERVPLERPLQIHGELGVSIGTGGYRGAFGTAVVPLGDKSNATVSFSTERDRGRYGGDYYGGRYDERGPSGARPR